MGSSNGRHENERGSRPAYARQGPPACDDVPATHGCRSCPAGTAESACKSSARALSDRDTRGGNHGYIRIIGKDGKKDAFL